MPDNSKLQTDVNLNVIVDGGEKAGTDFAKDFDKGFSKTIKAPFRRARMQPGHNVEGWGFKPNNHAWDGVKSPSLRQAAMNLEMTRRSTRLFASPFESIRDSSFGEVVGKAAEKLKNYSAAVKAAAPLSTAFSKAYTRVSSSIKSIDTNKAKNYLLFGTDLTKRQETLATMRSALEAQRLKVEGLEPTEADRTLAAKALNRGKWTLEGKRQVQEARLKINAYNAESAALEKLQRQYEKMEQTTGSTFGGIFSRKGSASIERKLGVLLSKNSIFSKKTTANNGLLPTIGYKVLRAGEIGFHGIDNLTNSLRKLKGQAVKKTLGDVLRSIKQFQNTFRRRLIARAVNAILRLAKEGLANLKAYSKEMGTPFYSNAVRLASSLTYMKNAFAAMVGPIVNALTPALERLMDTFANLANHIGAFFAAITGQQQFSAALKHMVSDAKAGAGKLRDILAFDEINRLSGDTGAGDDYSKMFEEWDPSEGVFGEMKRNLLNQVWWNQLGKGLADKFNELVAKVDSVGLGQKLGQRMQSAISLMAGLIENLDTTQVGGKFSTFLSNAVNNINWGQVGEIVIGWRLKLFDFILSAVEHIDWGGVGTGLGDYFGGILSRLTEWIKSKDWEELGVKLGNGLDNMIRNMDAEQLAGALWTLFKLALEGAWNLLLGLIKGLFKDLVVSMPDWMAKILGIDKAAFMVSIGFELNMSASDKTTLNTIKSILDGSISKEVERLQEKYNPSVAAVLNPISAAGFKGITSLKDKANVYLVNDSGDRYENGRLIVQSRASGGTVDKGQIFIANEAGPELIGTVGGKTTVTNQDQFTQGLIDANQGVIAALGEVVSAINSKDTGVYLDGKKIANNTTYHQNNTSRRWGEGAAY